MNEVYLKKSEKPEITPVDESAAVAKIIEFRELGLSKEVVVGKTLGSLKSDDVRGVEAAYKVVEAERKVLMSVSPTTYDKESDYKAELAAKAENLDSTVWYTKQKEYEELTTWNALKEKYPSPDKVISVPGNVKVSLDGLVATVSWNESTAGPSGVGIYKVYSNGVRVDSTIDKVAVINLKVYATEFSITVSAVNGDGAESDQSAPVVVTTEDAPEPEEEPKVIEEL